MIIGIIDVKIILFDGYRLSQTAERFWFNCTNKNSINDNRNNRCKNNFFGHLVTIFLVTISDFSNSECFRSSPSFSISPSLSFNNGLIRVKNI